MQWEENDCFRRIFLGLHKDLETLQHHSQICVWEEGGYFLCLSYQDDHVALKIILQ